VSRRDTLPAQAATLEQARENLKEALTLVPDANRTLTENDSHSRTYREPPGPHRASVAPADLDGRLQSSADPRRASASLHHKALVSDKEGGGEATPPAEQNHRQATAGVGKLARSHLRVFVAGVTADCAYDYTQQHIIDIGIRQ
jgi:predicted RNase H-like HicB family nuclease